MDPVEALEAATAAFTRRLESVGTGGWEAATPCSDWDVRALVAHVAGEAAWIPPLLAGETIESVGDRLDGDLLGDDPHRAWQHLAHDAVAAGRRPGATNVQVTLSYGTTPGSEYVAEVACDIAVHAWDLATAVGADTRLDAELIAFARRTLEPRLAAWRDAGVLGPAVDVATDADPQTRLLAAVGRRA